MESKRVEEEYQSFVDGNMWPLVYQRIGQRCQTYPYTCLEAKKTENKVLNRYRDVNPYDHSRIVLRRKGCNYINANLVKVESANRQYILTQGPLVYTSGHFWLMVWEQNSRAIIMLNKIIENFEIKCHWYWPHDTGENTRVPYTDVNMTVTQIKELDCNYYTIRKFLLTNNDVSESREIWHFHYTTWPDFGVPQSPHAFLEFLKRVRELNALDSEGEQGPAVVHCSAGIGRSGTFCLVDSVLVLIEKEGQANVDIQEILLEMRRHRMGLIQTSEQLRFSYKAIVEGIKRLNPDYVPIPDPAPGPSTSAERPPPASEEAPPPPPPRGESLGQPPARPLPAIPASASMDLAPHREEPVMVNLPALPPLGVLPNVERSLYSRRRARALRIAASGSNVAGQRSGGMPTLAAMAASSAGIEPRALRYQELPDLSLLAATAFLTFPVDQFGQPLSADEQLEMYEDLEEGREPPPPQPRPAPEEPADTNVIEQPEPIASGSSYMPFEDWSMSPGTPISPEDLYTVGTSDESSVDCEIMEMVIAADKAQSAIADDMHMIELASGAESDTSEAPPTPPPRDRRAAPRSPAPGPPSSSEDLTDDDDITESIDSAETTEGVSGGSGGGSVRRRQTAELAERVASMKKRSRDADRWHSIKRSLFQPFAISVGVGLLAVAGVLIYSYVNKH